MRSNSFFNLSAPAAIVAFTIGASCLAVPSTAEALSFDLSVVLAGLNEVPPNASPGSGSLVGTYDDVTNVLDFSLSFSDLIGTTTAAHFHAAAPVGTNAPVIIPLVGFPLGVTSGAYANSYVLTAVQENDLLADLVYLNIHTNVFPGGEIRGQLQPTLSQVPEPASLILLGGGVAVLAARRRMVRKG